MVVDAGTDAEVDRLFHALADATRRDIVRRVLVAEESVSGLARDYPMSVTAVQKHVAVLEEAGLVVKRRRGREQRVAGQPAPLQGEVDDHDVGSVAPVQTIAGHDVARVEHRIDAGILQHPAAAFEDDGMIVDDENRSHQARPTLSISLVASISTQRRGCSAAISRNPARSRS